MTGCHEDFAVLLEGLDHVGLSLARGLLEEAGIPHLEHGPDFDFVELGAAVHDQIRGRMILVPRSALERARAVIDAAWGGGASGSAERS